MYVSSEILRAALWLVGQYAQLIVGKDVQEWYESEAAEKKWVDEYCIALWGIKVIHGGGHVSWPPAIDDRVFKGEMAFHPEFDRRLTDQVSWAAGLDQRACYALLWLCSDYVWSGRSATRLLPSNFAVSEASRSAGTRRFAWRAFSNRFSRDRRSSKHAVHARGSGFEGRDRDRFAAGRVQPGSTGRIAHWQVVRRKGSS